MFSAALLGALALAQQAVDARLMKFPDIHNETVVFQYGGDLWLVPSTGGIARRITSSEGVETYPKFSPDGSKIAYTADYDGNNDVYVIPSKGGEPKRVTSHPKTDQVLDWTPDGKDIIVRSAREAKNGRFAGAFLVPADGGTPRALPMKECGQASPSPDGKQYAYNRISTENATWKQYRGGSQSWISFYDVATNRYSEMKRDKSAQMWPMWVDHRVFYVGDSTGLRNLWVHDTRRKTETQVTTYKEFDVSWPSKGPGAIVFVRDAKLWRYDIPSGETHEIKVQILSDLPETRPSTISHAQNIGDVSISPSGVRLALESRGEIFSVAVKEGVTRNMTRTPGARERYPRWSPDGKWILFASDRSGEYEFFVQKSDLSEPATKVVSAAGSLPSAPTWSPDSRMFFYSDSEYRLSVVDVEAASKKVFPRTSFPSYQDAVWSPDSKWIAYTSGRSQVGKVALLNVATGEETVITGSIFADGNPVFDASGKYLFFASQRNVALTFAAYEFLPFAEKPTVILGWTLQANTASPFAPKDESEKIAEPKKEAGEQKPEGEHAKPAQEWDLKGINERLFTVPIAPGDYTLVAAPAGKLLYISEGALHSFDMNTKASSQIIAGARSIDFTPKYDKFAYVAGPAVGVLPLAPGGQVGGGRVETSDMIATVHPREEWTQAYWEAWRYVRDYFWNAHMNGMNWKAVGDRYAKWLPNVAHRSDLDQLLWEMLADLETGHAYLLAAPPSRLRPVAVGQLGADYDVTPDGVRIKKIYRGQPWDPGRRGPLGEPGLTVTEGDYILSIDGVRIGGKISVDDALQAKANRVVELVVNTSPSEVGARKALVRTVSDETNLRYADWVESNRKYVEEKSGGRVGYIHVPSTSVDGVVEFWRMFFVQVQKDALIVDERYNSGGFIPDFFVEKLGRTSLGGYTPRGMEGINSPQAAHLGPKVMLINMYAGSGGDAFPYFFKRRKIGPLMGTRTWGGLIGISGVRDFMIGGGITVPQFAFWDTDANGETSWIIENIGVSPDIEVDDRPDLVAAGKEPQLDAAIAYLMEELRKNPPKKPTTPKYPGSGGKP